MKHTDVQRQDDAPRSNTFSKTKWKQDGNQYSDNALPTKTYGALSQFADTMGRIGRNDHVPCVWRRSADLQKKLGVGRDAFRSRLNELIGRGFLIEIPLHGTPGRRKMYIAKMPGQSEQDALLAATEAFRRYRKIPAEVRNALWWEIEHRGLWDKWEEQKRPLGFGVFHPGLLGGPRISLNKTTFAFGPVKELPAENLCSNAENPQMKCGKPAVQTSYIETRNQNRNRSGKSPSPTDSEFALNDAFDSETLIQFLRTYSQRLKLKWVEQTVGTIAEAYERRYHDSFALRTWLAAKILRLTSSKYQSATIAAYVLADVEDFFHTGNSSTVKPKRKPSTVSVEPTSPPDIGAQSNETDAEEVPTELQLLWRDLLDERIRPLVSDQNFRTWFANIKAISLVDDVWVLEVADDFFAMWIEENYGPLLEQKLDAKVCLRSRT